MVTWSLIYQSFYPNKLKINSLYGESKLDLRKWFSNKVDNYCYYANLDSNNLKMFNIEACPETQKIFFLKSEKAKSNPAAVIKSACRSDNYNCCVND